MLHSDPPDLTRFQNSPDQPDLILPTDPSEFIEPTLPPQPPEPDPDLLTLSETECALSIEVLHAWKYWV